MEKMTGEDRQLVARVEASLRLILRGQDKIMGVLENQNTAITNMATMANGAAQAIQNETAAIAGVNDNPTIAASLSRLNEIAGRLVAASAQATQAGGANTGTATGTTTQASTTQGATEGAAESTTGAASPAPAGTNTSGAGSPL